MNFMRIRSDDIGRIGWLMTYAVQI
jgi:hypothetical protein